MTNVAPLKVAIITTALLIIAMAVLIRVAFHAYDVAFRPGTDWTYTAQEVEGFIQTGGGRAAAVVFPILFPIDLILLISLGGFIALCSIGLAGPAGVPPQLLWTLLVAPVIYVAADFSENLLVTRMLTSGTPVDATLVSVAHACTFIKILSLWFGGSQLVLLGIGAGRSLW
jgi:hypothetical protein